MPTVKIEVVTPVHNRRELTLGFLRSLMSADLKDIDLHVIVVDDGSTDGTAEAVLAEFPSVQIIAGDGNLWYTGGMNAGIKAALEHDPDFVLGVNNDSQFEPEFLQHMLETARKTTRSVVGAVLVDWEDKKRVFQVGSQWRLGWGGLRHWIQQSLDTLPRSPFNVELIVGNCLLIPTAAIHEVGLMDAIRFPQYGDAEYTSRMRRAGWQLLIDPRAHVYCKPNDAPPRLSQMPVGKALRSLFLDPHHPHSLRRRLNTTIATAPSVPRGYAAFVVFFIRYLAGRNFERGWAAKQKEPPLSEIYASKLTNRRRQILYVWNYRDWGGAQIYFLSLMKAAKVKYNVRAMLPADSDKRLLEYLDGLGVPYEFHDPAPSPLGTATILDRLKRRLALFQSENELVRRILGRDDLSETILHVDMGFWQSFRPLYRLAGRTNVFMTLHTALPQVGMLRSLIWGTKGNLMSKRPRFHLMASNEDAKSGVRPYVTPEMFDRIEVAYSGYDPTEIEAITPGDDAARRRFGIAGDTPLIVTSGQFIERKGCWTVLESLKYLKANGTQLAFLWLGTATPSTSVLKRIEEYSLGTSFRLLTPEEIGPARHDVLALVAAADIFVLASSEEGLPISLVEAMALGRPCIATRVGAIPEAIEDGKNGILIEPNDPAALSAAITGLIENCDRREVIAAAAASTARARFNAERSAQKVVYNYDSVW